MSASLPTHRDRGQSMVEFLIVVPVLLMLILGALQFALVFRAKTTLEYAAFEAARAGALNNARLWAMENAFARAMAPLYTNGFWTGTANNKPCVRDYKLEKRLLDRRAAPLPPMALNFEHARCARYHVRHTLRDEGRSRILLINPTKDTFARHGKDLPGYLPISGRAIPNDNLMWRDSKPQPTAFGQQSIQDANLLKVHVGFCYELVVPFVNRIMRGMMTNSGAKTPGGRALPSQRLAKEQFGNFGPLTDGFGKSCAESGGNDFVGIPIYAESLMRMHSEAIQGANDVADYPLVGGYHCAGDKSICR